MTNQAELYKQINKIQMNNGGDLLKYAAPKPGEVVLDVGCGTGELTFDLSKEIGGSGKLVALDPDKERIQLAQESQPKEIKNIIWINDYFNSDSIKPKPKFDLIFSNYVYHWFEHKEEGVKLTADCLKPNGRFAIQFVYGIPECLELVREMANKPLKLPKNLRELWLGYFDKAGLTYEIKSDIAPYYFANVDDLLSWYEGTTHGAVSRTDLTKLQLESLHDKYPGEMHVSNKTLRLIGHKT